VVELLLPAVVELKLRCRTAFNSRLGTRTRAGMWSRMDANDSAPAPCGVSSVLDLGLFGEGAGGDQTCVEQVEGGM
jgi:hypothetical protein